MTRTRWSLCEIAKANALGVIQCRPRVLCTRIVALCDAVKNGWHGEVEPEASPMGESKSNEEVKRFF